VSGLNKRFSLLEPDDENALPVAACIREAWSGVIRYTGCIGRFLSREPPKDADSASNDSEDDGEMPWRVDAENRGAEIEFDENSAAETGLLGDLT
jgi:hypothetical protein